MWLMPSRGRRKSVERFFRETKFDSAFIGLVGVDADDAHNYYGIPMPPGWELFVGPPARCSPKLEQMRVDFPDESFYGIINDDMLPETPGWEAIMAETAIGHGVAWPSNGVNDRKGMFVVNGQLVRDVGWFGLPDVLHNYGDDAWELIAASLGIGKYRTDVVVRHYHPGHGTAPMDETYKNQPAMKHDKAAYATWKADKFPALLARLEPAWKT